MKESTKRTLAVMNTEHRYIDANCKTLKEFRIAINQLVDDDNMPEVLALIDKDRERARIDELKQLWNDTQPDIVPEGAKANDMSERLHDRIAELQSSCNKRGDSDE